MVNSTVVYIALVFIFIIFILIIVNLGYSVTTYNTLINDRNDLDDAIKNVQNAECLLKETNQLLINMNCKPCPKVC